MQGDGARCLFLSHHSDLHTAVVGKLLHDYVGIHVDNVSADAIAGGAGITFFLAGLPMSRQDSHLNAGQYDLIWARRLRMPQRGAPADGTEADAFANSESQAAIEGACLAVDDAQIVVNPILAERRAESKVWQLYTAPLVGFNLPKTICSNNPADIRTAVDSMGGEAVVKKLRGTHHRSLLTIEATHEMLSDDVKLASAPLIVQQRIDAECHYRVHVFLDKVIAFRIESEAMDWRPGAGRGATYVDLPPALVGQCQRFREACGLYYCILDLIQARDETVYFLECNPQGQFLFLEQRTEKPLSIAFAAMLLQILGLSSRVRSLPTELPI